VSTARRTYDEAIAALLRFRPEVVDLAERAIAEDADLAIARALRAYIALLSSEAHDARGAGRWLESSAHGRGQTHFSIVQRWASGDWYGAARALDALLDEDPGDTLALAVGHQLDFFTGDAANLRDRAARALARMARDDPARGFAEGMWAFGLEECGDYRRAEEAGRAAVTAHPDDVWAIHAVAHVCEMEGRADDGIRFLDERGQVWQHGTFFNVHLSWHRALFGLEHRDYAGALAIYDRVLHPSPGSRGATGRSAGTAIEMVDATALLWRLFLDEIDTGDRLRVLADAWAAKDPRPWYVFNDLHALMAFVGSGRLDAAASLVARLDDFVRTGDASMSNWTMVAAAGLAVARALLAFGRRDYRTAVDALAPMHGRMAVFGGSHAQRDAFERTLVVAAERAGETSLARRLVDERRTVRPTSRWR